MSQEFFDPELFADFIAEAKEHLETIEPNLLELEKTPDNLALLNDIFRPMHSLKGASGFLGLNRINLLAHKSENILDELRKGSMLVTSEIMDVILASTDALRQMIDNLENSNAEGDVETEHIIEQIDAILAGEGVASAPTTEAPASGEAPEMEAADTSFAESTEAAPANREASGGKSVQPLTIKEWVASLPLNETYALTAFGEGHLKDFIDESLEIIESLNSGLLELEENPTGREELVNDLFRYFHNMKGNSGIIGYHELNALTHEAETLLNNVRQGKITASHELIDLLLLVADVMENLIQKIDIPSAQTTPLDITPVIKQLQTALAGGNISLPQELLAVQNEPSSVQDEAEPQAEPPAEDAPAETEADTESAMPKDDAEAEAAEPAQPAEAAESEEPAEPVEVISPAIIPAGTDGDDMEVFRVTVTQQIELIRAALGTLQKDGSHKDSIDATFRCLTAIKNACGFMGEDEIKVYADRTAGIVDQGRRSGIDFGMMVDLLSQEVSIIDDMLKKVLDAAPKAEAGASEQAPAPAPEAKPVAEPPAPTPAAPAQAKNTPPSKSTTQATPASAASAQGKPKPAPAAAPAATEGHKGSSTIR
ncbi:MAG: Hpt domain-containing protein, partial [Desulfovibrionaceae bacterium]|nr:Hpt domain-containing protein [Desulfovibrionaceae bacterium]